MTEAEWLKTADGSSMFEFLAGKTSNRKLRLYFVAYLTSILHRMPNDECRKAINVSELFADGAASLIDLQNSQTQVMNWQSLIERQDFVGVAHAREVANVTKFNLPWPIGGLSFRIREIFGNPFRPVTLDPAWLTPTVLALANGIYADRAFDRMPILADALEEAGCENDDILLHCRQPGEHVRGCWVVDLVLGKK
jgi:hypothetical protein